MSYREFTLRLTFEIAKGLIYPQQLKKFVYMAISVVGYLSCLKTKSNVTTAKEENLTPGEKAPKVSPKSDKSPFLQRDFSGNL